MVLTSECKALITRCDLDELNEEFDRNSVIVQVYSQPIDPDTEPELLCERHIAREV